MTHYADNLETSLVAEHQYTLKAPLELEGTAEEREQWSALERLQSVDGALLSGRDFSIGTYELVFHAGDYLRAAGHSLVEPAFLDIVPIRFGIADALAHYHVPLLISPYGYSTYRGS